MTEVLNKILEYNPGIVTTIVTALMLPILMLVITNWQTRRMKRIEQKFDIEKEKLRKQIELGIDPENSQKLQENVVYSSLIKILFEIQKLHIELSGNCSVDYSCITKAVEKFQSKFSEYQEIISENQMYLKPKVTNELYDFYQNSGNLLIELKEIENDKKYELAQVSVYFHAQSLASIILRIQENLSHIKKELDYEIKQEEMGNFINCCGRKPDEKNIEEYKKMNPLNKGLITLINASMEAEKENVS
ncbi:hypothetical protein Q4Q39_07320 [Flavivirga amylovorans]|uniref:Uncharacterized protein n=1 Tax=Flavivirga amylovorans TaxID=870486 RepID=A0ABT8WZU1_9FLAO|nr:hypothetical protein [Flavivirga amylovorans]MDO5987201.1 hypothetical protein [Flavivirga amylovorans]